MNDGIYLEIFASKGGKRINIKIVSLRQLSNVLTNGLMNSIEELIEIVQTTDEQTEEGE